MIFFCIYNGRNWIVAQTKLEDCLFKRVHEVGIQKKDFKRKSNITRFRPRKKVRFQKKEENTILTKKKRK